jgi:thioredoxin-related protein
MQKTFLAIILVFASLTVRAQTIDFMAASWDETVKSAEKKDKNIFVYAQTKSCQFCRQMEREVFTNPKVFNFYNANFICLKIDIEDGAAGEAFSKRYGIIGFPTYLFFDKNGTRLHQSSSFKPAVDFIQDGKNASDPHTALFAMLASYDRGNRSPELLFNLSHALSYYMVDNNPKERITDEYLSTQSVSELESEKNLRFIFTSYLDFKSYATRYLLQNQKKFIGLFGKAEVEKRVQRIVTQTASTAGRTNNLLLLNDVKKIAAESFSDSSKISSLAQIYFYGGQQDWLNYAKSTFKYGNTVGATDWQTMYETGAYLKHFASDPETLQIGVQIMNNVLKLQKNYEHLCIYAQLQKKLGNKALALEAAQEALEVSKGQEEDESEAKELIAELAVKTK